MIVAVAVGVPDRILIGPRHLPGNLIPACRLLRANRRPATKLPRHNVRAGIFQLGARSACDAIKEKIVPNLDQAGRAKDSITVVAGRNTDHPIAVQVLVETGLERLQRCAGSRHRTDSSEMIVAVAVGVPDRILIGTRIFQATSYPLAVCSAPIGAQPPNCPATTFAPPYFSSGPDPLAMLSRKKLFPTSPGWSIQMIRSPSWPDGIPITPSPFKSWWKLVSSDCNAELVPDTAPIVSEMIVAVAVGVPDRILIGTRVIFQATSYPLAVCSAPIGAQPPN